MLVKLIELIFKFGPLVFGIGFLVPLVHELIVRVDVALPYGLSAWALAFAIGGGLGLMAQVRGSWIWQK
jgi:hypothetical protein